MFNQLNLLNYGIYYNKGLRESNQDSIALQRVITSKGELLMAIICDGLGGMDDGEIASGYIVEEFSKWFYEQYQNLVLKRKSLKIIINSVNKKLFTIHNELKEYGYSKEKYFGSTFSMLLVNDGTGLIFHIGDSAIYSIDRHFKKLTPFHLTEERNLSACVGIASFKKPFIQKIKLKRNTGYLLSSDGFYHYLNKNNIKKYLNPRIRFSKKGCDKNLSYLASYNLEQGEKDNMSAIYLIY